MALKDEVFSQVWEAARHALIKGTSEAEYRAKDEIREIIYEALDEAFTDGTKAFVERLDTRLRKIRINLERWESGELVKASNTPHETEKEIYALRAVEFQFSDLLKE